MTLLLNSLIQNLHLSATDTGHNIAHTIIISNFLVLIMAGFLSCLCCPEANLGDPFLRLLLRKIAHQHAAAGSGDDLISIKRKYAIVTKGSCSLSMIQTSQTLCRILDHRNSMLFTDLHDPIHVCRKSIQMHWHNCLHIGIFLKGTLQCFRRHIPGLIITVDKDRNRFLICNGIGRCREGQILAEHNIASLHSSCFQCQMKSCRACGQCRCIL